MKNANAGATGAPDVNNPVHLEWAATVVELYLRSLPGSPGNQRNVLVEAMRNAAKCIVQTDAADRALAEQIAGDWWADKQPKPSSMTVEAMTVELVLNGIRAGRDAERTKERATINVASSASGAGASGGGGSGGYEEAWTLNKQV